MSYTGMTEGQRKEVAKAMKEAQIRLDQMRQLEQAIKEELKTEIQTFKSTLHRNYKVLDLEEEILAIRRQLVNDASGKAQSAADQRIMLHHRMTISTNMSWGLFINSFGLSGWFNRF